MKAITGVKSCRERPGYVSLLMLYGLFMVLYLPQADVQSAFRRDIQPPAETPAPVQP